MEGRFKQCVDYLKEKRRIFNASDLARITGSQKSYISELISEKRPLSERFVLIFTEHFPEISKDWLLTGDGEMVLTKTFDPNHTFKLRTDHNLDIQNIPLYDFEAAAGLVSLFNDHSADPVDFLKIPNLPSVDGAVFVRGESMYPLLKSGDIVIYKKKELSIESIIWGEIYLLSFNSNGDTYTAVKYVQKSEDPEKVRLVSFNPAFAPKDIPLASITALALVKASITFHTME